MSHIYVVQIGTTVKVGESGTPGGRFTDYVRDAGRYGLDFVVHWVSPAHREVFENERALLTRFRPPGQRDEYLRTADPDEVAAFAQSLPMTPTGDPEISARVVRVAYSRGLARLVTA